MSEIRLNLIASYAKSGSNWTRMVLENYLRDSGVPASIWATTQVVNGFSRRDFERVMGIGSTLLEAEELWRLMPCYLRELCQIAEEPLFFKIHDANLEMIPPEICPRVRVIYLIRNPLDVAVSYSHHFCASYEKSIDRLGDPRAKFSDPNFTQTGLLPIRSNTWSTHAASWVDQSDFPVEVLRYEDLVSQPLEQFSRMIRLFLGEPDEPRLKKAVEFSALDELRRQEGGRKKAYHRHRGTSFFRKGRPGTWRDELTPLQVESVENRHGALMRRFGYV